MIRVTYIDGNQETFEKSGYYLYTEQDTEGDEPMLKIYKNKFHPDDDDFDSDESSVMVEIRLEQLRKIEYDD